MVVPGCVIATAPAQNLTTKWSGKVDQNKPLPEYPRPQLVRDGWTNLNGQWDFQVTPAKAKPGKFEHKILVPFAPESKLSNYRRAIPDGSVLRYRRTFTATAGTGIGRTLLHFGAVDWSCSASVNGKVVGSHKGGYDPFTFDITDALNKSGSQELVVTVTDPTDAGVQPRGKQSRKPEGIFYTPVSGIWQTVWLEQVPNQYIDRLWVDPHPTNGLVGVRPIIPGNPAGLVTKVEIRQNGQVVATAKQPSDRTLSLLVSAPKLWSPDSPTLYDMTVSLHDGKGKVVDKVTSYFAFRTVTLGRDARGRTRIMLNGKPLLMVGPLDQGFWPDGIYTAPTDEAMKFDLEMTKQWGFNMIRKHVKVEPERWYTYCDRMGILVWQDMVSGDRFIGPNDPDIKRTPASKEIFLRELKAMVDTHRNHPSIVTWVLFNEGWGQFETKPMTAWLKSYDPSRIVDSVTGWADRGVGDMHDIHVYPGPASPRPEPTRAAVLGEFGGLGLVTPEHMWHENGWGYQTYKTREELTEAFEQLFFSLRMLAADPGLSAAVYTQTTDVETELNGLMTYDRAIMKMDPARVRKAVRSLFLPPPTLTTLLPDSEEHSQRWHYTFDTPPSGWEAKDFDHSAWREDRGGFGTNGTSGASVGTIWDSKNIWIRRQFAIEKPVPKGQVFLRIHHDDNAEVYLDGKLISTLDRWTTNYTLIPLPNVDLSVGRHVIAIHCYQDTGGQYIDAGLVRVQEKK